MILQALSIASITGVVEAFGLYFLRLKTINNLFIAMAIYGLGVAPLLYYALNYEGIGMVNFLWNICSTLFGFAIGIYLFKEKVQSIQLIGVIISLLGLGIITLAPEENKK
jgi:drug/metabolite transporter (DMT)-like permease